MYVLARNMLAHVLFSLLVFEQGFIQIRIGSFEFFYTISFLLNLFDIFSLRSFHDIFYNFFIDEKHYAMNFGYWSKSISWQYFLFHEMTLKLYFMKCHERKISQCILPFNWTNFIVWLPLLLEILDDMCIVIVC